MADVKIKIENHAEESVNQLGDCGSEQDGFGQ
jgi:hypothetical protein